MKKNIKFEEAIEKLEEITDQLERGSSSLDEIVKLYEEGTKLVQFCQDKLQNIELKIETIKNDKIEK